MQTNPGKHRRFGVVGIRETGNNARQRLISEFSELFPDTSLMHFGLFAQRGARDLEKLTQQFIDSAWTFLSFGVVMIIGVWAVVRIRARFKEDEGFATSDHRLLSEIGNLQREGDLSDDEYRSIKSRLVTRLEDDLSVTSQQTPSPDSRSEPATPTSTQHVPSEDSATPANSQETDRTTGTETGFDEAEQDDAPPESHQS